MNIGGISNVPMMNPLPMPVSIAANTGLAPASMDRMDQLIQLIQGYTSAEILMALLMAHGPVHHRPAVDDTGSVATAAYGLAQATQMASAGAYMALPAMGAAAMGGQISVQG